jgi:tetratricopeptide (TPR) repeat protein
MQPLRWGISLAAILVLLLAVAGFLHLYNTNQQEVREQAVQSLDLGISLFRENKYSESLKVLQGIPDGVLEDWHLPYYTATAMVMLKDYESAVPELEEALALSPQETVILFELGVVYFKLGKVSLSKGYFASVVEIDPANEEARGLMDIMADLERRKHEETSEEQSESDKSGAGSH